MKHPTGRAGLDVYEAQKDNIALLVLDSEMPRLSGREMLTQVRLTDPDLPVLLVTGYMRDAGAEFDMARDPEPAHAREAFRPRRAADASVKELLAARPKR